MSTSALILCDGAQYRGRETFDHEVNICRWGASPNLKASIIELSHQLFTNLKQQWIDLIRIASFVYRADGAVTRGTEKDVYAQKWQRMFRFVIPVVDPEFWNEAAAKGLLMECLSFLSGDQFVFDFVDGKEELGQRMLDLGDRPVAANVQTDSVLLVSGGLDSLAAAIEAVKKDGLRPVLVSQWSNSRLKSRQESVVEGLREKIPEWPFPWLGMWVQARGPEPIERTQRCRAFLFLCLAFSCAAQLGVNVIRVCDNGLTSVNVPHTDATWGTFLTRSTHPQFLDLFARYVSRLSEHDVAVENSLLFSTKADVVRTIIRHDCGDLIRATSSCARTHGMTNAQPHCGVCYQCIDRRFATEIADAQEHDLAQKYKIDVFKESIPEGDPRTHLENYVRFARSVQGMSVGDFVDSHPAVWDSVVHLPGKAAETTLQKLGELHIRHAKEVWQCVEDTCEKKCRDRVRGQLPSDCLVSMVFSGELENKLDEKWVRRLGRIFETGLPKVFQNRTPENEGEVQDAGEGLLNCSNELLDRETPGLPFAGVGTRPDFSKKLEKGWLFLEFKYPRDRRRLNGVISEMTSRVLVYRDQDAKILFVVFDPTRAIIDDAAFRQEFEKHEGVWVTVVR